MLKLPELPFAYDALEPHMSAETLTLHHDKHHAGYVKNANGMIEGTDNAEKDLETLVRGSYGSDQGLFNNVGQHYNHAHFWEVMKPGGNDNVPADLLDRLTADFGSLDDFKDAFKSAATGVFGSGWCWAAEKNGKIEIMGLPNAENPLVHGGNPILGLDVWEHSYYVDHRNDRGKYVDTFLNNLVNWGYVAEQLKG